MYIKEENEIEADRGEGSTYSKGIGGWDRVDKLTRDVVNLTGLCVTSSDAKEIRHFYNDLLEYDKRPLVFQPVPHRPPMGRFGRLKRSGHATVDYIYMYMKW